MAAKWTAFVSGAVLTAQQLNDTVDNFADIAIFNETQASGTNGGAATTGSWQKRTLNTTVVNNITGCSIASSVVTLPAGTYRVRGTSPALSVGSHKNRLQNTTAATTTIAGTTQYVNTAVQSQSEFDVVFTIATTSNFELQHFVQTTIATNGFGGAAGFASTSEVYSILFIQRVA
jgi:hypothetical protein